MRVFQLAKELKLSSKELIKILSDLGIEAKSHMNELSSDSIALLKKHLKTPSSTALKEKAKPKDKTDKTDKAAEKVKERKPVKKKEEKDKKEEKPKEIKEESKKSEPIETKSDETPPKQAEQKEPTSPVEAPKEKIVKEEIPPEKIIKLELPITAKELALKLNIRPTELIAKLISLGVFASINQNLAKDIIEILLHEYDLFLEEISIKDSILDNLDKKYKHSDLKAQLLHRAPVITFMGHVDHGKTLLLDTIRKTKVVESEFGGITQHIGAYKVSLPKGEIVFLDTPGHEAFTAMRARGANVTDIAVLIVAADDGVMPQTLEAIDHAKAANVPIVVAINKIDRIGSNPEKVKRQLVQHGVMLEGWGGDVVCCEVSALKKMGIDHFLEMLLLQAELLELTANPNRRAIGSVIESKLTKDKGPVVTVLVRNGTLRPGDPVLCGMHFGKVKALLNDHGNRIEKAGPSTPVEILGLGGTPDAGAEFFVTEDEREAKEISTKWRSKSRVRLLESKQRMTLSDLYTQMSAGLKELKIIVKADAQGSVEALSLSLEKQSTSKIGITIIHSAVGDVSETDISLAIASNAIIVGFHVKANNKVRDMCRKEGIDLRLYNIIYQAIEDIMAAMEGLLEPTIAEKIIGKATVKQIFKMSKTGIVAGCMISEGKLIRNNKARIMRNGEAIHEDLIVSLKRFKDEVKEVLKGYECGLKIGNFTDYKEEDIIEAFILESSKTKL